MRACREANWATAEFNESYYFEPRLVWTATAYLIPYVSISEPLTKRSPSSQLICCPLACSLTNTDAPLDNSMIQAYDLYLFNGTDYTINKLVDDLQNRYGFTEGDGVLLWPTYTNLGRRWHPSFCHMFAIAARLNVHSVLLCNAARVCPHSYNILRVAPRL